MVDFVGVGINSVDTLIRLPRFPAFDSKVEVISSEILPGGEVATAAVACQRWGLQTRYVGKVGDDFAAQVQRESLQHEGMEIHLIEVPQCSGQTAFILVDQSSGERTILWKRDARLDLLPDELRPKWITHARLLHVDGHPSAPAALAAQWARQAGITVMADLDNLYPGVEALLEHADLLISSREFPERLIGIADPIESLPEIARRFGCRVVGVALGAQGTLAWDGERFHYSPAFRVDAVDTTGAGDLFHAGFAYCLLEGRTLADTLEFSCAAAALNCMAYGARGGIRPISEIEALMRGGPGTRRPTIPAIWYDSPNEPRRMAGNAERPEYSMIPLRAENPRRTFAVVNLLLIVLNIGVFIYQVSLPERAADKLVLSFGVVPARAEQVLGTAQRTTRVADRTARAGPGTRTMSAFVPLATSLFTSMFLHGGILHLLGNMLFLWVFGAR